VRETNSIHSSFGVAGTAAKATIALANRERFGFVDGHHYLTRDDFVRVEEALINPDATLVHRLESGIGAHTGRASTISFASARMAFFALLLALDVGPGDEVVLTGFTCAVMCNAVMRTGARPVYCDIDESTFGTSPGGLSTVITPTTRVIVAQHSFGVPCDIRRIREISSAEGIFLIEDCAIALGSTVAGAPVGSFGDAAIVSTDHSKPVNTLIGGFVTLDDEACAGRIRDIRDNAAGLSDDHQHALLSRLRIESRLANPTRLTQLRFRDLAAELAKRYTTINEPFLTTDSTPRVHDSYPYPAPLPSFLAQVGLLELERWPQTVNDRERAYDVLRRVALSALGGSAIIPLGNGDQNRVIPHRLVWSQPNGAAVRAAIGGFVEIDWTWFLTPIVATTEALSAFDYQKGCCPTSELIGRGMVNIPLPRDEEQLQRLAELLGTALTPFAE